jgi:hypothetical protein
MKTTSWSTTDPNELRRQLAELERVFFQSQEYAFFKRVFERASVFLGVNNQRITSVGYPKDATDAVTKAYVDATAFMVTVPFNGVPSYSSSVSDSRVTASSKVDVTWQPSADTDENTPELDNLALMAVPGLGAFTVYLFSYGDPVGGVYNFKYTVN